MKEWCVQDDWSNEIGLCLDELSRTEWRIRIGAGDRGGMDDFEPGKRDACAPVLL